MNGFYAEIIAILKQNKFWISRQKGSHQTWTNGTTHVTVSTNCPSRHTANAILKQSGIKHRF
jgi:predicted RNA binding protein YcfA (HicA-like mRNA interferase family)